MTQKYILFISIVLVSVFADLVTKRWAEDNLASRHWEHTIERQVDPSFAGKTLEEWGTAALALDPHSDEGQRALFSTYALPAEGSGEPSRLLPSTTLKGGERLEIRSREIEVVPGFWNHVYVRNYGAAWGTFAETHENFRKPFFFAISIVAFIFIASLFRKIAPHQWVMNTTLALIVSGAIGNFIDRVRLGYVVDFIDWYVMWGDKERHWPTFNIADVCISIGVVLMILQALFSKEPAPASGSPDAAASGDAPTT